MRFGSHIFRVAAATIVLLIGAPAVQAAPIHVSVFAGGAFGVNGSGVANSFSTSPMEPFVFGGSVAAGDTIEITATGSICLSGSCAGNGPDGQFIDFPPHSTVLGNSFGALAYALVPADIWSDPAFLAYDADDVAVGISASFVHFAGSSLTFTAAQAGAIYFGIADSDFSDNSGPGFDVTMTITPQGGPDPVPEPAALSLIGLGLIGVARRRHKRPSATAGS